MSMTVNDHSFADSQHARAAAATAQVYLRISAFCLIQIGEQLRARLVEMLLLVKAESLRFVLILLSTATPNPTDAETTAAAAAAAAATSNGLVLSAAAAAATWQGPGTPCHSLPLLPVTRASPAADAAPPNLLLPLSPSPAAAPDDPADAADDPADAADAAAPEQA
eukprot:432164-Prorocentrum_minimum.AAC.2